MSAAAVSPTTRAVSSTKGAEAVVELLLEQQQEGTSLDVGGVAALLEAGADPNACVREDDVSPMHIAAGLENDAAYAYLALLLKHEGDFYLTDQSCDQRGASCFDVTWGMPGRL